MSGETPGVDAAWNGREAQDYPKSEFVVPLSVARQLERRCTELEALAREGVTGYMNADPSISANQYVERRIAEARGK